MPILETDQAALSQGRHHGEGRGRGRGGGGGGVSGIVKTGNTTEVFTATTTLLREGRRGGGEEECLNILFLQLMMR